MSDTGATLRKSSSAKPPIPRRTLALIVGVVSMALVATGILGWFLVRPDAVGVLAPESDCPAPTEVGPAYARASQPGGGTTFTMPVSLGADLPEPDGVRVVGVWCGVAVIDFMYAEDEKGRFYTDILRGIDILDGAILWTADELPNGEAFLFGNGVGQVIYDDKKLALLVHEVGTDTGDSTYCSPGTHLIVMSIRGAETQGYSVHESHCSPESSLQNSRAMRLVAYRDGIMVVDEGAGSMSVGEWTGTVAYRETDLDTPLWSRQGESPATALWSDALLPGDWVRSVGGRYVSLRTGTPSAFDTARVWVGAGDVVVGATVARDRGTGLEYPGFDSIEVWRDPGSSTPTWEYSPQPGSWIGPGDSAQTRLGPLVANTQTGLIILVYSRDAAGSSEAWLVSLAVSDGAEQWSAPIDAEDEEFFQACGQPTGSEVAGADVDPSQCVDQLTATLATIVIVDEAQSLLFVTTHRALLVDVDSGGVIAERRVSNPQAHVLSQCGSTTACLAVLYPGSSSVIALDLASGGLETTRTHNLRFLYRDRATPAVYGTSLGLFTIIDNAQGGYEFVFIQEI